MTRRLLPVTMGVVVAFFLAATAYSQFLLTTDAAALDIASNAAPSIAEVAEARAALGRLARDRTHAAEPRRAIDAALAEYSKTPDYAGERELYAAVLDKLRTLDARLAAHTGVDAALDDADGALGTLSRLNYEHLQSSERSIARTSRMRSVYAFVLDGVGIVIAFFATVLAARTVERYIATLGRRTRELEHLAIQVGHDIANPLAPIQVALHTGDAAVDPARQAAFERGRRALARIRDSVERLSAFAAAGMPPPSPSTRTPLAPSLAAAAGAAGVAAPVDAGWYVGCPEAVLRELLGDLLTASVRPGAPPLAAVEVVASARQVRVSVARAFDGDRRSDPFDPELHTPGAEYPGIDLRLAKVRRRVEAYGGTVGVRRRRQREELWIDLPRA